MSFISSPIVSVARSQLRDWTDYRGAGQSPLVRILGPQRFCLQDGRVDVSIAVNPFGEAVIGYNRSGSQTADVDGDGRPDGRITLMAQAFVSDGGGGLDPAGFPLVLRVSDVDDYRCGLRSIVQTGCFNAWGDTSAVTIDPTDPRTFYAIGEYAAPWAIYPTIGENSVWHTYVARIRLVPEPGLGAALMVGVGLMGWIGSRRPERAARRAS